MRIKRYGLILSILACSAAWPADRWAGLEECQLAAPGGVFTASARCGELEVAENPADPEGRKITLTYAVLPARADKPRKDPVAFLAGGPGQSAREALPVMRMALRDINRDRDLIFLDQRGTGGSNILDCDFGELDAFIDPDWGAWSEQLKECMAGWEADVRFYTTAHGADDLDTLRAHFGFERLNLIGGSYGTRTAQVYLRRYPERVRSVILDAVAPTRLVLGSEHAPNLDRALDKLFEACAADPVCNERFPGLSGSFAMLKHAYDVNGPRIEIPDPRTGEPVELDFTRTVLASALRFLSYQPHSQMMIPYLVHEAAATGDPRRLASQLLIVVDGLAEMIAIGPNFTVGCSEDWPRWPHAADHSDTLLGNTIDEFYARVCAWWPAGEVDPDFHQPFDSAAPVLILSGELDPVTPPAYGDEAAAQYSNSLHLTARGRGHIVLVNPCVSRIASAFVERASFDNLDTACMDRLGPEPFFLNLLGPPP